MSAPRKPLGGRAPPGAAPASSMGVPSSESAAVAPRPSTKPDRKRERKRRPKFVL
jgi:hypothetical protein